MIEREARANGIDPFIYYSLIRQESLFEEGARQTEEAVRAEGGEVTVMGGVDLGDAQAAKAWIDQAAEVYGGFDILYNNASTQRFAGIEELSVEDWDYTMRNELNLVFYACKAAWPHLKKRGGGVIKSTT